MRVASVTDGPVDRDRGAQLRMMSLPMRVHRQLHHAIVVLCLVQPCRKADLARLLRGAIVLITV
jgi:hypothetical protein